MKKILFITEHPAPYWDQAFETFEKFCDLNVIYIDEFVSSKPWQGYKYYRGTFYKNKIKTFSKILKSDKIIIGGYYRKELRILLFISFLLCKSISLFSDVPRVLERNPLIKFLKRITYKRFKYFFISGKKGIEFYLNNYNIKNQQLIYLPYSYKSINYAEDCEKYSFQKFNVLISSRFLKRKGHLFLVKALELLSKEKLSQLQFIFLGDGPTKNQICAKLDKISNLNYKALGWVSMREYNYYLDYCNVLIHPSLFEPFGIPIIDSLNRGLIVISSDKVMSACDFIKSGTNGFIYSSTNYRKLSHQIENLFFNRKNLKKISINAKNSVPKYEDFVKNVINVI